MKIKCQFCDAMINDTLDKCPNCGAPNPNVVRTANDQPKTIEELKKWYQDHGLPPYETTRFFIGENYEKPKAFGIYQDGKDFIVYKNKDTGERAVRYKGSDEAYAVNELYMRLKQEIIQQKQNNLRKARNNSSNSSGSSNSSKSSDDGLGKGILKSLASFGIFGAIIIACFFAFCLVISALDDSPSKGYYNYNGNAYYYFSYPEKWFEIDNNTGQWSEEPLDASKVPSVLETDKSSKEYYLSYDWKEDLNLPNFEKSTYFIDYQNHPSVGYYQYNNSTYYNMRGLNDSGWYYYDDDYDWVSVDDSNIPDDLRHYSTSQDFYYTPTWDANTQFTDFETTSFYQEYVDELEEQKTSESSDDYSWDSSDSWDSDDTDWGSDW